MGSEIQKWSLGYSRRKRTKPSFQKWASLSASSQGAGSAPAIDNSSLLIYSHCAADKGSLNVMRPSTSIPLQGKTR